MKNISQIVKKLKNREIECRSFSKRYALEGKKILRRVEGRHIKEDKIEKRLKEMQIESETMVNEAHNFFKISNNLSNESIVIKGVRSELSKLWKKV